MPAAEKRVQEMAELGQESEMGRRWVLVQNYARDLTFYFKFPVLKN